MATFARDGGRLTVALLPLVAFALLRATGAVPPGTLPDWVPRGIEAVAALACGASLLLAIGAHLERGRTRDLADATGLGLLAGTLAGLAAGAVHPLGSGIGILAGSVALATGSLLGNRRMRSGRRRWAAVIGVTVVIEVGVAAALFGGAAAGGDGASAYLLLAAAALAAVAAGLTRREGGRPVALGVAAASFTVLAIDSASNSGRLPGWAGIGLASVILGLIMVRRTLGKPTVRPTAWAEAQTLPEVKERLQIALPNAIAEPEFDEAARLRRELRATLDDLVAARRTIGLQRDEIERASAVDPLTGVPGRGPTLERLATEAAEARRYGHPLAVVLLDVDGFAQLNHEHGLETGDVILREVALRLRLRVREADLLGRVGGDAFLAILPHTDESGAATFAGALLDRLVERPFSTERGEMTVAISIGIALMRAGMTFSGEELLAAAEEALASAKAAGGNRIAFDRLHGLARLDERRPEGTGRPGAGAAGPGEA
jgi:diguanylate cyclase (GGDEF)-like protein